MSASDFAAFAAWEKSGWSNTSVAENYASGFAEAAEQCSGPIADAACVRAGDAVVDICCGQGSVAEALRAKGCKVTGLDFSPAMLDMARSRVPQATFVEGDAMELPFNAATFDAATMGFGILHVPDGAKAMAEVRRVLKPGGRFVYTLWHPPSIPSGIGYLFAAIAEHGQVDAALPAGPGLFDWADADKVTSEAARLGFEDVTFDVVPSFWTADAPDLPVDHFRTGTVRGSALLNAQSIEAMAAIRASVSDAVKAELGPKGPWRIPAPALLVSMRAA